MGNVLIRTWTVLLIFAASIAGVAAPEKVNEIVVQMIEHMPAGCGYAANNDAITTLGGAIRTVGSGLSVDARGAAPTFCSGATYLVFLSVVDRLRALGTVDFPTSVADALMVQHQPDGTGVWGRWNANGPGTARMFFETGMGTNFTDWDAARPGDFLKLFWNDEIGAKERGHSVVFLARDKIGSTSETLTYWSSQAPEGYGKVTIPRSRVHRAIFSRFDHPERLANVLNLTESDLYLADMLKRASSEDEMLSNTGVARSAPAAAAEMTTAPR